MRLLRVLAFAFVLLSFLPAAVSASPYPDRDDYYWYNRGYSRGYGRGYWRGYYRHHHRHHRARYYYHRYLDRDDYYRR
jgi:hypothetical protein